MPAGLDWDMRRPILSHTKRETRMEHQILQPRGCASPGFLWLSWQRGHEILGSRGGLHLAFEDPLERRVFPVYIVNRVFILPDLGSADVGTGKRSVCVRIGKNWRFPTGGCTRCIAAVWSRGRRRSSQVPMTALELIRALLVHEQHNILMFCTRLQAYTSAGQTDESGSAPARSGSTAYCSSAVLTSNSQTDLGELWNDRNALRLLEQGRRNLVGRNHVL
jgi:hypothetical protein